MAGEWTTVRVQDIAKRTATGPFGSAISSKHFLGSGVPVIRGSNLSQVVSTRLDDNGLVFVSEEKAQEFKRSEVRRGDLVFTCWGTIDQVGLIDARAKHERYIVSNKQMLLTPDSTRADSLFLYYYFASPDVRAQIINEGIGSSVPGFNLGQLRSFEIPLPPLAEQKAIAAVLGALDDKIELNRRMNATLEAMARALFQSWFVDFDPVRAKLDGRPPAALDPATAALFPERLEETTLGHTPKGWEVRGLDKTAHYLNGLALQKYPPGDGPTLPVIKIAQLRKGDSVGADRCNTDLPLAYVVQDGDVLFSWSGSLEVELWCGGPGALNQHLFKVTSPEFPKWFYYLWTLYHLDEFRLIAADKATTMGHIQRGHLTAAKVLIPPRPLLDAMTRTMSPLIDQFIANRTQSRTLAILRDTLLPKLLSGEMSVAGGNAPELPDSSNRAKTKP
jgi:type I restriction enzyme S subunit